MKKFLCAILVFAMTFCCTPALAATANYSTTQPSATTSPLLFDVPTGEPLGRFWPIMRLGYKVYIDYQSQFETTDTTDNLTGKPINWTPVEPVQLYQLSDGSWSSTAPDGVSADELRSKPFYLIESDHYYRVIADYGSRTQNLNEYYLYPFARFSLHNVYSGMLPAGRTGGIGLELDEQINGVSIIHRCQLNIATVDGANFMPLAYASNIDGKFIITYYPTDNPNRAEYYSDREIDFILPGKTISIPVRNVLY